MPVPVASFRGALDWPVAGRVTAAFGGPPRPGGVARNGIEIGAPEGAPVTVVHPGTVDYADAFSGFGNLVIVDHGGNYYSLYGYLGSVHVMQWSTRGCRDGARPGRHGAGRSRRPCISSFASTAAPSIPVQWLKPR